MQLVRTNFGIILKADVENTRATCANIALVFKVSHQNFIIPGNLFVIHASWMQLHSKKINIPELLVSDVELFLFPALGDISFVRVLKFNP